VSAPALTMNGISYNGLGTGGGLIFSLCQSGLEPIPSPGLDVCATGANDVYFFLVTVFDMPSGHDGSIIPETKITLYNAGNPTSQSGDHYLMMSQVLDAISGQSFSGYEIDGYGPALLAPASGAPAPYTTASPLIAQQQVCSIRSGSPAYLRWDADQQAYIGSYTPLSFGGEAYNDIVIWGMEQFEDEPNVITAEMREKPIWWADGMESVSAGVVSIPTEQQTIKATVFAPLSFFTQLQTMGIPIHALATDALGAPADPGGAITPGIPEDDHYTWNQSALGDEITLAPTQVCVSGSYQIIGATTANPEGGFAAQVSPFDIPGDHHIFARSHNPETGEAISTGSLVTYRLQTQTTPSIIQFISPLKGSVVGGVSFEAIIKAAEDFEVASLALYVDGAFDSQTTQTATGTWSATLYPHLLGDGPRALSAVAIDIAGNSATASVNIIIDIVAPNPPINVIATKNPDGTVALTWTPPVTNEDGSPISDLLGYSIYMVSEQNRCEAVSAVSGDTTPLVCERSGAGGGGEPLHNIDGPSLSFGGTDYNINPLGTGALWLNVDDQENTMSPLPLVDATGIDPEKPVFAFMLNLEFTARTDMPAGEHKMTAYTQNTLSEVERWLANAIRYGALTRSSSVAAHAPVCEPEPADVFSSRTFPLLCVPIYRFENIYHNIAPGASFILPAAEYSSTSSFTATALDASNNESEHSAFVVIDF